MKKVFSLLSIIVVALCLTVSINSCTTESQLEIGVAVANSQCPIDCGSGLEITDVTMENGNVVYNCNVNESVSGVYDIQLMKSPEVKEAMMAAITIDNSDPDVKAFMDAIKETGTDIIFRFNGIETGESVQITIDSTEL